MEIAEIALAVFTASGFTYGAVRSYRLNHTPKLKRELPVGLWLRTTEQKEKVRQCVVLVFDHRGCLTRKFPQAEWSYRKDRYRIKCASLAGEYRFCVLLSEVMISLSNILCRDDVNRLFGSHPRVTLAETDLRQVSGKGNYELSVSDNPVVEETAVCVADLSEILPPEVVTDAMAKELVVDLHHYSGDWTPGTVAYADKAAEQWLSLRRRNRELVLQLRTNFDARERRAVAELRTATGETYYLPVHQRVMGEHPTLSVSRRVYVTPGVKHEAVELTVTPDGDTSQWTIRRIDTSDGGRWWTVQPAVGTPLNGVQTLRVHLEAKPANVCSRSAVVTLETGTYPFNQTTEICLMQGVCFDYYIEYPAGDACTRHTDVIETPLPPPGANADATAGSRKYVVRVDSNQAWHLVKEETASWVQASEVNPIPGSHGGIFTVQVESNAGYRVRGGFPAARHTTLSLINDTGIVKDIFIYQGGYVHIRGIVWLDRNLASVVTAATGGTAATSVASLPEIAIPLGLREEEKRRTWGSYYQFGKPTDRWSEAPITSTLSWNNGTEETPGKRLEADPSPQGWRVPSRLELSSLLNRQAYPVSDQLKGNGRDYLCLLSDDGVPFFLPLCGHLSHINGCRIGIPRGNRYWCGTSQSPIYGHSLCIEPSRQTSIVHDMKKYGFPLRCVLDKEAEKETEK